MRLVDLVSQETGVDFKEIMLLRHSTRIIKKLEAAGGSIGEYTNTQPTGSRYDFRAAGRSHITVVVEIVHDRVRGVYRVLGIEKEGTTLSLVSEANKQFYLRRGYRDRPSRRFRMERIPSRADDAPITGWEGRTRSTTARSDGKLFGEIEVDLLDGIRLTEEVLSAESLYEGSLCQVTVNAYERNRKARLRCIAHYGSICVICGFGFGAVYGLRFGNAIHTHHLKPLSEIGEEYEVDPVADLRPVCPNCHAIIHHGGGTRDIKEVKRLLDAARRTNTAR